MDEQFVIDHISGCLSDSGILSGINGFDIQIEFHEGFVRIFIDNVISASYGALSQKFLTCIIEESFSSVASLSQIITDNYISIQMDLVQHQ